MLSIEVVLIALALSIDAFLVSVAVAATGRMGDPHAKFRLSFHFGLFQFLMPVLGWAAGATLEPLIASFDHWLAFGLLLGVGVHMLRSGRSSRPSSGNSDPSKGLTLVALSTATSMDALAVGFSLAMLNVGIWTPCLVIGGVTGLVSYGGILLGGRLQGGIGRVAEFIGGSILILIALRILISHVA